MAVCDGKWPSRTEIVFWFKFCTLRLRWIFIFIFISIFSICPFFHSFIVTTCESLRKILFSCVRFVCVTVLVFVYSNDDRTECQLHKSYRFCDQRRMSSFVYQWHWCAVIFWKVWFSQFDFCAKNCHLFAIDSTISKRQENTILIIWSFFSEGRIYWCSLRLRSLREKKTKMNQTNCEE